LHKYKNLLCALANTKVNFKSKRTLLVEKGGFIVPLLTTILSSEIGALINNSKEWHCNE